MLRRLPVPPAGRGVAAKASRVWCHIWGHFVLLGAIVRLRPSAVLFEEGTGKIVATIALTKVHDLQSESSLGAGEGAVDREVARPALVREVQDRPRHPVEVRQLPLLQPRQACRGKGRRDRDVEAAIGVEQGRRGAGDIGAGQLGKALKPFTQAQRRTRT